MSNHGHVTPNPDGSKARCGGPMLCQECALLAAAGVRPTGTAAIIADRDQSGSARVLVSSIATEIANAAFQVASEWPPYNTAHEALGILREEYTEFENIVFQKQADRNLTKMRKECIDIAVVAIRTMMALEDQNWGRK